MIHGGRASYDKYGIPALWLDVTACASCLRMAYGVSEPATYSS
jgi:hypothetical protein